MMTLTNYKVIKSSSLPATWNNLHTSNIADYFPAFNSHNYNKTEFYYLIDNILDTLQIDPSINLYQLLQLSAHYNKYCKTISYKPLSIAKYLSTYGNKPFQAPTQTTVEQRFTPSNYDTYNYPQIAQINISGSTTTPTANALRLNIFETNDTTNDIRYYNDAFLDYNDNNDNNDNEHYDNTMHNDQDFQDYSQDDWNQNDEQDTLCLHHQTV